MLNPLKPRIATSDHRRWLAIALLATCLGATNACTADCADTLTCPSQEGSPSGTTTSGAGAGAGTGGGPASCVFDESAFEAGCGFGP